MQMRLVRPSTVGIQGFDHGWPRSQIPIPYRPLLLLSYSQVAAADGLLAVRGVCSVRVTRRRRRHKDRCGERDGRGFRLRASLAWRRVVPGIADADRRATSRRSRRESRNVGVRSCSGRTSLRCRCTCSAQTLSIWCRLDVTISLPVVRQLHVAARRAGRSWSRSGSRPGSDAGTRRVTADTRRTRPGPAWSYAEIVTLNSSPEPPSCRQRSNVCCVGAAAASVA